MARTQAKGRKSVKKPATRQASPARSRKPAARSTAKKKTRPAAGSSRRGTAKTRKTTVRKASTRKPAPRRKSALRAAAETVGRAVTGTVAAVAAHLPGTGSGTDAIELLEKDHRKLEGLLDRGAKTTTRAVKRRDEILAAVVRDLSAHELIEEKILYPALKAHPEAKDLVLEGYQEHHVADVIIAELQAMARSDERWGAKFKVLKENIEHHIEEEEGEMFRTARALMSRAELAELGARMQAMKSEALR